MQRPTTILPSALSAIGDTPLVRLNRIPQREGVLCNVCE
jgi:cystathionine beta-synthase